MGVFDIAGRILGTDNSGAVNQANATMDEIGTLATANKNQNQAMLDQYLAQMQDQFGGGAQAYENIVRNLAKAIGGADYSGYGALE